MDSGHLEQRSTTVNTYLFHLLEIMFNGPMIYADTFWNERDSLLVGCLDAFGSLFLYTTSWNSRQAR